MILAVIGWLVLVVAGLYTAFISWLLFGGIFGISHNKAASFVGVVSGAIWSAVYWLSPFTVSLSQH